MSLGLIALLFAGIAAGWLLLRVGRGEAASASANITVLKMIVWLGLVTVLFAAKLWPLAFMVLLAAGGVMLIEMWRGKTIAAELSAAPPPPVVARAMTREEASAALGISHDAGIDDVKAAHKKLIAQIHPDKGGTDYLAAKINEARDLLLNGSDGEG